MTLLKIDLRAIALPYCIPHINYVHTTISHCNVYRYVLVLGLRQDTALG